MGYLGATLIQVFTRACTGRADVSLRDVTMAHIGSGVTECGWHHAPEEPGGFWEILKKSVSWDETWLGGRRLVFACSRRPLWRVPHVLGGRWKSQNRKIVPPSLSLCRRTFKLKGNKKKSFVPEQRSRYVFFSEFQDSYVLSLWTFDVRFTHRHIMAMVQLDFQRLDNLSIAVHAFARRILMLFSVDEMQLYE